MVIVAFLMAVAVCLLLFLWLLVVSGVFSSWSVPGLSWDGCGQVISMSTKFIHQHPLLLVEFPLERHLSLVQFSFSVTQIMWEYSKTSNNGPSEKCTADSSLAPDWYYHRTNTFWTSEKQTPLNSKQKTLTRPRHTLANTKLPPKTELHPHNADVCRPLS